MRSCARKELTYFAEMATSGLAASGRMVVLENQMGGGYLCPPLDNILTPWNFYDGVQGWGVCPPLCQMEGLCIWRGTPLQALRQGRKLLEIC